MPIAFDAVRNSLAPRGEGPAGVADPQPLACGELIASAFGFLLS
jgi:hypothetical protein